MMCIILGGRRCAGYAGLLTDSTGCPNEEMMRSYFTAGDNYFLSLTVSSLFRFPLIFKSVFSLRSIPSPFRLRSVSVSVYVPFLSRPNAVSVPSPFN